MSEVLGDLDLSGKCAGFLAKFAKDSGAETARIVGREHDDTPVYAVLVAVGEKAAAEFIAAFDAFEAKRAAEAY